MATVFVNGRPFAAICGETLSDFLLRHRLIHPHPCGGKGTCLACRLTAIGNLSAPSEKETSRLSPAQLTSGVRLCCQTRILGDATLSLPAFSGGAADWFDFDRFSPEPSNGLGLAIDVGTTTCAFALCDLHDGTVLTRTAVLNPQINLGQDVLSRISHTDAHPEDVKKMQSLLIETIDRVAADLCRRRDKNPSDITRAVCVGNTVMLHYLAGLDPSPIGRYPYTPPSLFNVEIPAKDLGFSALSNTTVFLPPCIGPYVGADVNTGLLLLPRPEHAFMFVDMGTNGEIAAYSEKEGFLFTSAAAGPAFEGGGISCGMPAVEGAIVAAALDSSGWDLTVQGGREAKGICGSGLLDAIHTLLSQNRLSPEGKFIRNGDAGDPIEIDRGTPVCRITDSVYLLQDDIYRFLLAKAAIAAALDIAGDAAPASTLYIGGGFGTHIPIRKAKDIGLFGSKSFSRVLPVGNTALGGAVTLLISPASRNRLPTITRNCRLIDLNQTDSFQTLFLDHLTFSTERM